MIKKANQLQVLEKEKYLQPKPASRRGSTIKKGVRFDHVVYFSDGQQKTILNFKDGDSARKLSGFYPMLEEEPEKKEETVRKTKRKATDTISDSAPTLKKTKIDRRVSIA